jgi:hypothetical protein
MIHRETTPLTSECATTTVREISERLHYQGELLIWPPTECGNKSGAWVVVASWERHDRRGNVFSHVDVYLVWGDADGRPRARPYFQQGPCVSVNVGNCIYFADHDGKIHLQLAVSRIQYSEFEPPWMED